GAPPPHSIGLLDIRLAICPPLEGCRTLWVNGQGAHSCSGQAGVDGTPAVPAIGALENAIAEIYPRIERGRRVGVDGQRKQIAIVGQAGVDGAPTPSAIRALENATAVYPRIERGRRLRVSGQRRHIGVGLGGRAGPE